MIPQLAVVQAKVMVVVMVAVVVEHTAALLGQEPQAQLELFGPAIHALSHLQVQETYK